MGRTAEGRPSLGWQFIAKLHNFALVKEVFVESGFLCPAFSAQTGSPLAPGSWLCISYRSSASAHQCCTPRRHSPVAASVLPNMAPDASAPWQAHQNVRASIEAQATQVAPQVAVGAPSNSASEQKSGHWWQGQAHSASPQRCMLPLRQMRCPHNSSCSCTDGRDDMGACRDHSSALFHPPKDQP